MPSFFGGGPCIVASACGGGGSSRSADCSSRSGFLTASSISSCEVRSFVALRKERIALPRLVATSGSRLGPRKMSAMARMTISSPVPRPNMSTSLRANLRARHGGAHRCGAAAAGETLERLAELRELLLLLARQLAQLLDRLQDLLAAARLFALRGVELRDHLVDRLDRLGDLLAAARLLLRAALDVLGDRLHLLRRADDLR